MDIYKQIKEEKEKAIKKLNVAEEDLNNALKELEVH